MVYNISVLNLNIDIVKKEFDTKVGIIVYSHIGNALSVAEKIKEGHLASRHSANLEQVIASDAHEWLLYL